MTSKSKKILEDIHPLHIIREVQKWPPLYVKDSPERANLHIKNKIWKEIAKQLFNDWDSYGDSEKESKDLIKKWRNLRDTFKRQLANEKKVRQGYNIKKKTYVYFKHMLFLLPHVSSSENEASDSVVEPKLNEYFNKREKRKATLKNKDEEKVKRKKFASPTLSESVEQEEIDEDRHFLMSLVPSFRKMSDDEKLSAKVRILKVIKDIRRKSNSLDCIPVADTLLYNFEDADIGEIKVEMLQNEANETPSNDSDSDDSENSD
ncbi:uncharacterized protein LOC126776517 isoform X2 [Nymphalis io]|uniref:uncharacterized protein LOC126776517 isoform X2 n=1 Tax=Inachis io TaxID=171585 RepID=UPI002169FC7E|nr:uncharacterized protein LOC126776517 isoform X2 [Nymphalis io]